MSKFDKAMTGIYLVLRDYARGEFPPTFLDQAAAYQAEIEARDRLPGWDRSDVISAAMRKPFWSTKEFRHYVRSYSRLLDVFEQIGVHPKRGRVLEIGCGTGWMCEFLALAGYSIVGSTLSDGDVEIARRRVEAIKIKGVSCDLRFVPAAMESLDRDLASEPAFDCVFVFEALHHAFDWRRSLHAAARCLVPGGWLVLANEPNIMHTIISYRVSKLDGTHEIGMSRSELTKELKQAGFASIRALRPVPNDRIRDHWIVAQKPVTKPSSG